MSVCITKSNKFEHLEIKLLRFSYLSIKSLKLGTLKDTMIKGFKLVAKKKTKNKNKERTPKRYQKLEFQTLKVTTSTPTILPYKKPPRAGVYGLTSVTVHMSFSLPRVNFERRVPPCTLKPRTEAFCIKRSG